MTIKHIPGSRVQDQGSESITVILPWGDMRDSAEIPLTSATYPKVPTYDTGVTSGFDLQTQTNAGTTTNIWWLIWLIPATYLAATDLTLKIDGKYTLGGDAVKVASTIDLEAFPYDATNGDYSNTDICATVAQALTTAFATLSFTLTGSAQTPGVSLLLRFTSVIQITSAGGAGTGYDTVNFPRIAFTGVE